MTPLLLLSLLVPAEAATPFFGVSWRPLSRADLVWVEEGRTSGTAVGEFDGSVRSVFDAFGGVWINRWVGLSVGLGLARATSTTFVGDEYRSRHQGVFRPSLDLRIGFLEQVQRRPVPWVVVGVYGDIPSARDVSNGYTEEEQLAADQTAASDRARLGGIGGKLGVGVDYRLLPGLLIGATVTAGLHRSTYAGGDEAFNTLWVATEAALLLTFEWPPAMQRNAARAARKARKAGRSGGAVTTIQ